MVSDRREPARCDGVTRRDVLRLGSLTALGLSVGSRATLRAASARPVVARARSCILIWLDGGPSHLETFDPKPEASPEVRGPFSTIATSVPGVRISEPLPNLARRLGRVAIIRSMTPGERQDPKIINGSRRARIAKGSGVHVSEVGGLVERFFEARKMMQNLARGGGIPGMPGIPGAGGRAKQQKQKQKAKSKGKRQSGNPAKRAQQEREAAARAADTDGVLGAELPIAMAKARASEAAGVVARIAHQVHGAIGFTREHDLRLATTRLWAWRDEDGSEAQWQAVIGAAALAAGPEGLWPLVTGTP